MSLPVTIEVAEELEQNHGFKLEHAGDNPVSYYHVFPSARWVMAVTSRPAPKYDFLPLEAITSLMLLDADLWNDYLKAEYGNNYLEDQTIS